MRCFCPFARRSFICFNDWYDCCGSRRADLRGYRVARILATLKIHNTETPTRLSRTLEMGRWAPILQIWHDSAEMSYVASQP